LSSTVMLDSKHYVASVKHFDARLIKQKGPHEAAQVASTGLPIFYRKQTRTSRRVFADCPLRKDIAKAILGFEIQAHKDSAVSQRLHRPTKDVELYGRRELGRRACLGLARGHCIVLAQASLHCRRGIGRLRLTGNAGHDTSDNYQPQESDHFQSALLATIGEGSGLLHSI